MEAIYSLLAVVLDRLRGSGIPNTKSIFQILLACSVGLLISIPTTLLFVAFVFLFLLGCTPGWGNPISRFIDNSTNADYESWQVGALKQNVHLALFVRGIMWGVPVMALYPWCPQVWTVAVGYTIAFYFSILISKKLYFDPRSSRSGNCVWAQAEWIRGVLAMLTVNVLMQYNSFLL